MSDECYSPPQALHQRAPTDAEREQAFAELAQAVHTALETYANVHRGSGQHSMVTTNGDEQARNIILASLGRTNDTHTVIFCTPRRAATLERQLDPRHFTTLSSQDVGLPLLAVNRVPGDQDPAAPPGSTTREEVP